MIKMEEAVQKAFEAYYGLYNGSTATDPLLEGVELADDGDRWKITIGFNNFEIKPPSALDQMIKNQSPYKTLLEREPALRRTVRRYRLFEVSAEDGHLEAMRPVEP